MTRLAEWLTVQVDADEAAARAAWPGPWELRTETGGFGPVAWVMMPIPQHEGAGTGLTSYVPLGSQDAATAGHIALHDPARALAEVAFKRAILAGHAAALVTWREWEGTAVPGDGAGACIPLPSPRVMMRVSEARSRLDAFDGSLRAMAKVYKDRPGYAEAIS